MYGGVGTVNLSVTALTDQLLAGMFSYSFSVSAHPAVMIFPPNNKNKFQISLTSSQILAPPHTSLVPTEHKCNMGSIAASFSDDMQQRREELVL